MYLIKLQNKRLSHLINPQIIPLAPSPIIPQILLPILAISSLNLLKLLHELQINGADVVSLPEMRLLQCFSL